MKVIKHILDYFNSNIEIIEKPTRKQLKQVEDGEALYYITTRLNKKVPKNILNEYEDLYNSYLNDDNISYKKVKSYYDNIDSIYKEIELSSYFDTNKYHVIFKELVSYDSYGSGVYELDNEKFYLFNNYGDSDLDRNPLRFHTIVILDSENKLHCCDISYNIKKKLFFIENYRTTIFPEDLIKYSIKEYTGKRAYYYYPKKKEILFRCSEKILKKIDKKYHDKPSNDVSGNKIILKLNIDKL